MAESDSSPTESDAGYSLLADRRRRCLLRLVSNEGGQTVEELVESIAECERRETGPDEDRRQPIRISLVHNHLPRLADHGVVEYDRERHTVSPGRRFEEIRPLVELADPTADGPRQPSEPFETLGIDPSERSRANCDE